MNAVRQHREGLGVHLPVAFPLPDSHGWLKPEPGRSAAIEVRIIQHDRRDGTVYVAQAERPAFGAEATAHRRVDRTELFETEAEAIGIPCKPCRGTGQRKRTRKGIQLLDTCPRCDGAGRAFA